ncbi:MAG: phosphoribosylglycinamide formyltransferase [Pyrinomonadaceae bacterium]
MKIAILISGRGSNMVSLAEAVASGAIPDSEIVAVISDKSKAAGLEKAKEMGLPAFAVPRKMRSREEHDAEIVGVLKMCGAELICLAGYMRLLSAGFVREFRDRILNIHPSLLPSFKGLDAQKQALEYGVKISGCTVHFVDEELDHGAIILQKAVEVREDDTDDSLSSRILAEEHRLYVEAVRKVVLGEVVVKGRTAVPNGVL